MANCQRLAGGVFTARAHSSRAVRGIAICSMLVGLYGVAAITGKAWAAPAAKPASGQSSTPGPAAPGLAQPQFLTPTASPYPRTPFDAYDGALQQPQFVTPSDEVIVSDIPVAEDAPSAPAVPAMTKPPSAAADAPTSSRSKFWRYVLGPSDVEPTDTAKQVSNGGPTLRTTTPRPSPATDQTSHVGSGLWRQLLGTSSPLPKSQPTSNQKLKELANPFLLTSAESESSPPASSSAKPAPATHKQEAPRVESAGLFGQLGMATEPPAQTAQGSHAAQQPAESVAAALWRPLAMTSDAPPVEPPAGTTAVLKRAKLPESERVPRLLRPFYATNPPNTGSTLRANGAARGGLSASPQSLAEIIGDTSLARQWSMSIDDELRTVPAAKTLAEQSTALPAWDGTMTVEWPLLANPFLLTESTEPAVGRMDAVVPVAFLQDTLPPPPPSPDGPQPDALELPTGDAAAKDNGKKADGEESDSLVDANKLGTAPEDTTLEFLRTATVLLDPGKMQFDVGLEYTYTENEFPILLTDGMGTILGVDEVLFKGRELAVPMEIRYGLLRRVQVFLQVPVGWANTQVAVNDFDAFDNDGGIGDVGFGATVQLRDAVKDCPYMIGTVSAIAPTGGDPFTGVLTFAPNAPSLGNGFWSVGGNLLWIQPRYDPVVVFYGLGARYQFEHEYVGINFEPGPEYDYTLGAGFAVNERVTFSTQFFGAYIEELKADGVRLVGTNQEPMSLRLAATMVDPCKRIVEPFVTFGLTSDAVSANIGITWTY